MQTIVVTPTRVSVSKGRFVIFGTKEGTPVLGELLDEHEPQQMVGVSLLLHGEHGSYNGSAQFRFSAYEIQEDPAVFFLNKMVKIPRPSAVALVKKYGGDLTEIIEHRPQALLEIKGIKEKTLTKIQSKWPQFARMQQLAKLLLPAGITNNMTGRIFDHFGDAGYDVCTKEPYRLIEIRSIGFKLADALAMRLGVSPEAPDRLCAAVAYCLEQIADDTGATAVRWPELKKCMHEELGENTPPGLLMSAAAEAAARGQVQLVAGSLDAPEQACFALSHLAHCEQAIFGAFQRAATHVGSPVLADIEAFIAKAEQANGYAFGDQQRAAIRLINAGHPITAIFGYAGTGKTTTGKAFLDLCAQSVGAGAIVCCALAGIAANRAEHQTGYAGRTIHSLLGYRGEGEWVYNRHEKLPYKVIMLDEGAMVPSALMYRLLDAIDFDNGARLIISGDVAQLRPVGPGMPLLDALRHNLLPMVELTQIFRTDESKIVNVFAQDVRNGRVPSGYKSGGYSDFRFVDCGMPNYYKITRNMPADEKRNLRLRINQGIQDAAIEALRPHVEPYRQAIERGHFRRAMLGVKLLSPMKEGPAGVRELNRRAQELLNPPMDEEAGVVVFGERLRAGDCVLHMRNREVPTLPIEDADAWVDATMAGKRPALEPEDVRVMNGQSGIVLFAGEAADESYIVVAYPNERYAAIYSADLATSTGLSLGYALTAHKSQGSEYGHVIQVVSSSHFVMLDSQMIYTEMTRMRDRLTVVGESYAFESGCKRVKSDQCLTVLSLLASECAHAEPLAEGARKQASMSF